jgi:hypothetical protein
MPRIEDLSLKKQAQQSLKKLFERFGDHPQIELIDLGYDPQQQTSSRRVVLRVHVRQPLTKLALGLPDDMDGIPIVLITAKYKEQQR